MKRSTLSARVFAIVLSACMVFDCTDITSFAAEAPIETVAAITEEASLPLDETATTEEAEEVTSSAVTDTEEDAIESEASDVPEEDTVVSEVEEDSISDEAVIGADASRTSVKGLGTDSSTIEYELMLQYPWFVWSGTMIAQLAEGYYDMTSIKIPAECTSIASYAFGTKTGTNYNINITEVDFSEATSLVTIHANAFLDAQFTEVDLSNCSSLTQIDDSAFKNCNKLTTVTFPDNLHKIGKSAFESTALNEVTFPGTETDGLTEIGDSAFKNSKITKVTDNAKTLTAVGQGIFEGNTSLTEVIFSEDIDDVPDRFFQKSSITAIEIPARFTEIGDQAFESCKNLTTVTFKSSSMVIGASAFRSCTSLSTINLPSGTTSIESNAFDSSGLTSIVIPNAVNNLGISAFNGCTKLTDVTLPSGQLSTIPNNCFKGCTLLSDINIPDNIIEIGEYAFQSDTALVTLRMSDKIKTIGRYAFAGCSFTALNFSNTITTIGDCCFQSCLKLTTVEFEDESALTSIGSYAFKGCSKLEYVIYPEHCNVTKVSASTYEECQKLSDIELPLTVQAINSRAFYNCQNLRYICLKNVTTIDQQAFCGCILLIHLQDEFDQFRLPQQLTTIGNYAFQGCEAVENLTIPASVTSVGQQAFYNTGIRSITFLNPAIKFTGLGTFGGTVAIEEVNWPEGITSIPANMFYQASFKNNSHITIPATVTELGNYAFAGTANTPSNIVKLDFEDEDSLRAIGNYALAYCSKLEDFSIPAGVTSIGQNAFTGCTFTSIEIPAAVTKISDYAFKDCKQLQHIRFAGHDVTSIGSNAFEGCTAISHFCIPAGVTTLGNYTFKNCTNMSYVYSPTTIDNIRNIGTDIFSGCNMEKLHVYTLEGTPMYTYCTDRNINVSSDGIYTITYDMGIATDAKNNSRNPESYIPEEPVILFAPSSKLYAFSGWYKDPDFTEEITSTEGLTEDLTVYAKWVYAPKYTLTYSGTYVDGFVKTYNDVNDQEPFNLPTQEVFQASAYTNKILHGWYTNRDTKTIYEPGAEVSGLAGSNEGTPATSVMLYPAWTLISISGDGNIKYNNAAVTSYPLLPEGYNYFSSITLPQMSEFEVNPNVILTGNIINSVTKDIYHFGDTIAIKDIIGDTTGKTNITIGLKLETVPATYYTITFDKNADDASFIQGASNTARYICTIDQTLPNGSDILVRPGYNFAGWYKAATKPANDDYLTVIRANSYKKDEKATLYAIWTPCTYNVSYDLGANEGEVIDNSKNPATITYGKTFNLVSPVRNGYTFAGWYDQPNGAGNKITVLDGSRKADVTLYAYWLLNTYNFSYNINGGNAKLAALPGKMTNLNSGTEKSVITITDAIKLGDETVRPGYRFMGWSYDKTASKECDYKPGATFTYLSPKNKTNVVLYATWDPVVYTINYELHDNVAYPADNSGNPAVMLDSLTTVKLANPTREGYTFGGWYTNADCSGKAVKSINKKNFTASKAITLHAKWTSNNYTLIFNANSGKFPKDATAKAATNARLAKQPHDYFDPVTLPGTSVIDLVDSALEDGIITLEEAAAIEAAYNSADIYLTKTNSVIIGWNTAKNGTGIHFDLGADVNTAKLLNVTKNKQNVTLYAEWAPVNVGYYTVSYHTEGGIISSSRATRLYFGAIDVLNPSAEEVYYEQIAPSNAALKLPTPIMTGYTFKGWYADPYYTTKLTSVKKGNVSNVNAYAKWEINTYTIKFNVNGGKKATRTSLANKANIAYTATVTLPNESEIVRDTTKYEFIGWSTVKNASVIGARIYEPGEEVKELTSKKKSTVTFYAQWKKIY
ncbi:MAG: leucine-rich repeat protein [Lachnospiraceae bacterium]|nr:leucine-rich repeat protein [Lachnospiraceae bacterium]